MTIQQEILRLIQMTMKVTVKNLFWKGRTYTEKLKLFQSFWHKLWCKTCNKKFAQNSNLLRHIQNIHSNNGPNKSPQKQLNKDNNIFFKINYQCPQCKKTYSNKIKLKRHLKNHNWNIRSINDSSVLFKKVNKFCLLICFSGWRVYLKTIPDSPIGKRTSLC